MTVKLFTDFHYHTEVEDVIKLFFEQVINVENAEQADIKVTTSIIDNNFVSNVQYDAFSHNESCVLPSDSLQSIREQKRCVKVATYRCISSAIKESRPWGSLTGIRPTKLAYQLIERENANFEQVFSQRFDVSKEKINLVKEILEQQKGLRTPNSKKTDLYIGIPFCISRCSYCSFTSGTTDKLGHLIEPYIKALQFELTKTLQYIKAKGIKIDNIYVGGGTPTAIDAKQLYSVLSLIDIEAQEFCVEAGRPDTINIDKLVAMKDCGVNRVSVNPQTFNQSVLDAVGRNHSVKQIYSAYESVRQFPFIVNMDLIAGLPTESVSMFHKSVDSAISLEPDNITVHTLALKKGSTLHQTSFNNQISNVVSMVDYASKAMHSHGYHAYYMYRQKYMSHNLENVGYCKPDTQCRYNIDIMEETASILACGANAISKRLFDENDRIERCANPKDILTYIQKVEQLVEKKFELFGM